MDPQAPSNPFEERRPPDPQAANNPFAPPSAQVRDAPELAGTLELASRGSRLAAVIIDGLLFGLCGVAGLLGSGSFSPDRLFEVTSAIATVSILLLVLVIANLYLIATRAQTIGKLLLKIRIVRADGRRAGFWRIFGLRTFVNALICSIPAIGTVYWLVDSLLIFRDSHQCVHDQIADTVVVKA